MKDGDRFILEVRELCYKAEVYSLIMEAYRMGWEHCLSRDTTWDLSDKASLEIEEIINKEGF